MLKSTIQIIVTLLILINFTACTTVPHPAADIPDGKKTYPPQLLEFTQNYLISPGDEIEVTYHVDVRKNNEYRIAIADQIRVEFYSHPSFDRTLNVRPDGKVTLPYKGDIMAFGKTPEELTKSINIAYQDLLLNPHATVTLIRYGEHIRQLKEAIRTSGRGQSRLALVAPDGHITLPLLKPIKVAGHTVRALQKHVNKVYKDIIPDMLTSVTLNSANGNKFYIFGAVNSPGYYNLQGPTTVTQALAIAKGVSSEAEIDSVLLISRNRANHPVGRLVDIGQILDTGNIGTDIRLKQSDIVFVPTSLLGRLATVGDNIRRMIPLDLSFSYSLDDTVNFIKNP